MAKIFPSKPFLIMLYGFPGSGKTYFARQLTENIQAAHVQSDRIRAELFDQPRYDKQEKRYRYSTDGLHDRGVLKRWLECRVRY